MMGMSTWWIIFTFPLAEFAFLLWALTLTINLVIRAGAEAGTRGRPERRWAVAFASCRPRDISGARGLQTGTGQGCAASLFPGPKDAGGVTCGAPTRVRRGTRC
jgi:hypothetical protein